MAIATKNCTATPTSNRKLYINDLNRRKCYNFMQLCNIRVACRETLTVPAVWWLGY